MYIRLIICLLVGCVCQWSPEYSRDSRFMAHGTDVMIYVESPKHRTRKCLCVCICVYKNTVTLRPLWAMLCFRFNYVLFVGIYFFRRLLLLLRFHLLLSLLSTSRSRSLSFPPFYQRDRTAFVSVNCNSQSRRWRVWERKRKHAST